jgi:hypothetical protein
MVQLTVAATISATALLLLVLLMSLSFGVTLDKALLQWLTTLFKTSTLAS